MLWYRQGKWSYPEQSTASRLMIMNFPRNIMSLTASRLCCVALQCDRFLVKLIFTGKSTAHTRPQHWSKRTPWHKEEEEGQCFTAGRAAEASDRRGSGSDIHRAWSWDSWRVHNNSHGARYREIQADNTWNKHRYRKVDEICFNTEHCSFKWAGDV